MMKFLDSIDLEKNIKSQYNNNRKQPHVVHIISRAGTQPGPWLPVRTGWCMAGPASALLSAGEQVETPHTSDSKLQTFS